MLLSMEKHTVAMDKNNTCFFNISLVLASDMIRIQSTKNELHLCSESFVYFQNIWTPIQVLLVYFKSQKQ